MVYIYKSIRFIVKYIIFIVNMENPHQNPFIKFKNIIIFIFF